LIILILVMGVFIYFRLDRYLESVRVDQPTLIDETITVTDPISSTISPESTPTIVYNFSGKEKEKALDFTLMNLEMEKVSLSDYLGIPVMINFWATWCPPCKAEMPIIQQFLEDYQGEFIVLAVNVGENEDVVQTFVDENSYDFIYLPDNAKTTTFAYGISGYPTSIFIDREGWLQAMHIGELTEDLLSAYLQEIGVGE